MKTKFYNKKSVLAFALATFMFLSFSTGAYATEAEYDRNVPYEGELITGTDEKGNNHTVSITLIDETEKYPGGNLIFSFEDVTGVHSKRVRFQEAFYRNGAAYDVYLVAPGTFNVTSNLADGFTIVETLSGKEFKKYAASGESGILYLSILADETAAQQEVTGEIENSKSTILSGGTAEETTNADAQQVYQEFLDAVSFIATDDTWSSILEVKGVWKDSYDYTVPDGERKIPYDELSAFDKFIYNYTYCTFASFKNGSAEYWNTHTKDRKAIAICYQDYLNFKPKQGNNREVVNAAFEKLWDWQYEYIKEHDEPYNFIANCSYTDMGFGVTGSGVEQTSNDTELSKEEEKEIKEAIKEIEKEMEKDEKKEKSPWADVMDSLSHNLLSIGILIAALVGLGVVVIIKRKKNIDDTNE